MFALSRTWPNKGRVPSDGFLTFPRLFTWIHRERGKLAVFFGGVIRSWQRGFFLGDVRPNRGKRFGVVWPLAGVGICHRFGAGYDCIDVFVDGPLGRKFAFFEDRSRGALWFTGATVDALVWIDRERIFAFVETINRTNCNAVGVFALNAWICNDKRHSNLLVRVGTASPQSQQELVLPKARAPWRFLSVSRGHV